MSRDAPFMVGGPSKVLTFAPLREQIGRLLDDFAQGLPLPASGEGSFAFSPCTEVLESASEVWINVELPGVVLNDLSVACSAQSIVVCGQKRSVVRRHGDETYASSREFGAFSQTFSLSRPADPDRVTAEFSDGVLSVRVPMSADVVMPMRSVPVTIRPI